MFKAATSGHAKVVTANRLGDGIVVFLDADGGWTVEIGQALVVDDDGIDEVLAYGKDQESARIILDSYAVDIEMVDGIPVPLRLREKIRADRGPTIAYGEAERAELSARAAVVPE
jgi:hypothetical protein